MGYCFLPVNALLALLFVLNDLRVLRTGWGQVLNLLIVYGMHWIESNMYHGLRIPCQHHSFRMYLMCWTSRSYKPCSGPNQRPYVQSKWSTILSSWRMVWVIVILCVFSLEAVLAQHVNTCHMPAPSLASPGFFLVLVTPSSYLLVSAGRSPCKQWLMVRIYFLEFS